MATTHINGPPNACPESLGAMLEFCGKRLHAGASVASGLPWLELGGGGTVKP